MSYHVDDYVNAKKALSAGTTMSKELGDDSTLALALHGLAGVAEAEGKYAEAAAIYRKSLRASERVGADALQGMTYTGLGSVAQAQGDYADAKKNYRKGLDKRELADDRRGLASSYSRLSVIAVAENDPAQARLLLNRSYETVYGTPGKQSIALGQFNLGLIEEASRQYKAALTAFQQCLILRQEISEKRGVARAMEGCAKMICLLGREKEAALQFGAADAIRISSSSPLSPNEHKKYGELRSEVRKKYPNQWNEGSQKVLDEIIVV
jgi:tetratricopeptide (TPR) repeat protein